MDFSKMCHGHNTIKFPDGHVPRIFGSSYSHSLQGHTVRKPIPDGRATVGCIAHYMPTIFQLYTPMLVNLHVPYAIYRHIPFSFGFCSRIAKK